MDSCKDRVKVFKKKTAEFVSLAMYCVESVESLHDGSVFETQPTVSNRQIVLPH